MGVIIEAGERAAYTEVNTKGCGLDVLTYLCAPPGRLNKAADNARPTGRIRCEVEVTTKRTNRDTWSNGRELGRFCGSSPLKQRLFAVGKRRHLCFVLIFWSYAPGELLPYTGGKSISKAAGSLSRASSKWSTSRIVICHKRFESLRL